MAAFDGNTALKTPDALAPVVVFEPGPREAVEGVSATRDKLLIDIYQNVKGKVLVATRAPNGSWSRTPMSLPDNVSTNVVGTNPKTNEAFISVTGFLTPSSIWLADAARGTASQLKTLAPRFDASHAVVEQMEATSKDGTKVPYFIVHPKSMARDGANPTILYAYGGFNASMTPNYRCRCRQALGRAGWRVRAREHSRWRRVRSGVARGRAQDPSSAHLR